MKNKETLEEAELRLIPDEFIEITKGQTHNVAELKRHFFRMGTQCQAERMYSEEEVNELLNLLKQSVKEINHIKFTYKDKGHCVKYLSDCESIIEQFKKK